MSNMAGWVGGDFVFAPQWASGRSNSGEGAKKFGSAGAKRKGVFRFNPNPTRTNHPNCQIARQSREDKEKFIEQQRSEMK